MYLLMTLDVTLSLHTVLLGSSLTHAAILKTNELLKTVVILAVNTAAFS